MNENKGRPLGGAEGARAFDASLDRLADAIKEGYGFCQCGRALHWRDDEECSQCRAIGQDDLREVR